METLLFDSYRVFQKGNNKNIIRRFFKLPVFAIVLFFIAIVSAISAMTLTFFGKQNIALICAGVEAVAGIVTFIYTEHYRLKTIDKRLATYRNYCSDVHAWLSGTGFVVTQQNIQEVLVRIKQQIERQEHRRKTKIAIIGRFVEALFIPFLLAVFSTWMAGNTDLAVLIAGALSIFCVVGTLGMLVYFVDAILSFYQKHKLEQWRCFADDLQGVIDTQFESTMIAELP